MSDNIAMLTPFVRLLLMAVSGFLVNRGIVDRDIAEEFATDPIVNELVIGVLMAVATFLWYLWSKSRAAVVERFK